MRHVQSTPYYDVSDIFSTNMTSFFFNGNIVTHFLLKLTKLLTPKQPTGKLFAQTVVCTRVFTSCL